MQCNFISIKSYLIFLNYVFLPQCSIGGKYFFLDKNCPFNLLSLKYLSLKSFDFVVSSKRGCKQNNKLSILLFYSMGVSWIYMKTCVPGPPPPVFAFPLYIRFSTLWCSPTQSQGFSYISRPLSIWVTRI